MHNRPTIFALRACGVIVLASSMASAWDGARVTYVTTQLEQRQGTLLELRDGKARFRDVANREQQIPLDTVAAIFFEESNAASDVAGDASSPVSPLPQPGQGLIITVDQQRLRGRPIEGDPGAESVLWDGPPFGPRVFALESLRALRPGSGNAIVLPERLDNDVLTFKNADRAPTFVESIVAKRPPAEPEPQLQPGANARDAAAMRARRATLAAQRRANTMVTGVVRADVRGVPTDIPLERIQSIAFANPSVRPGAMPRVWLNDSSVIAASSLWIDVPHSLATPSLRHLGDASIRLDVSGENVSLVLGMPRSGPGSIRPSQSAPTAPEPTGRVPLQKVQAIAFDASGLVPLSSCALHSEAIPGSPRRWTPPARIDSDTKNPAPLDAVDITLPGPMLVTIDLPATATHVGGTVQLPLASRPLASCRVNMAIIDGAGASHALSSAELSAKTPSLALAAPMPTGSSGPYRLRVTLDATSDGPIQDAVTLHRFLVAVTP